LEGKNVVLDGFCNPLSILTHGFSLRRIYLIIKRRRWKEAGSDPHYSNDYDLQAEEIKMTPHFAAFLKAVDRITPCQYQCGCSPVPACCSPSKTSLQEQGAPIFFLP
jgi:hypothetical protein